MLLTDFEYLNNSDDAFRRKISLQIKRLRRQNQVTQEKFFTDTNINIGRLESGKIDIRLETLRRFVTILMFHCRVFLGGFINKPHTSTLFYTTGVVFWGQLFGFVY